jgi:HAD superfamily hydrolase (TIGR01509 family)
VIDAVLFDNDGVLVDTERLFFQLTREAFAEAGADLTPGHWMRSYLGEGLRSLEIAVGLGVRPETAEEMVRARDEVFRQRLAQGVPPRPGVREALTALRGRVRMALVTSSPRDQLELVHRSTGLLPFFEFVVAKEDCERPKPAADPYLEAVRRLGVSHRRCLAVEDSARGVASALAAGVRCALIPHELTERKACGGADYVEPEIGGIVSLVEELLAGREARGRNSGGRGNERTIASPERI